MPITAESLVLYLGVPMVVMGAMTGALRSLRGRTRDEESDGTSPYAPKEWTPLGVFDWISDIVIGGLVGFMWAALIAAFVIAILAKVVLGLFAR
jgi:hypothetical protein